MIVKGSHLGSWTRGVSERRKAPILTFFSLYTSPSSPCEGDFDVGLFDLGF